MYGNKNTFANIQKGENTRKQMWRLLTFVKQRENILSSNYLRWINEKANKNKC